MIFPNYSPVYESISEDLSNLSHVVCFRTLVGTFCRQSVDICFQENWSMICESSNCLCCLEIGLTISKNIYLKFAEVMPSDRED